MEDIDCEELEFLRYFYDEAKRFMGCADSEIYSTIQVNYMDSGGKQPKGYYFCHTEEEE